MLTIIDHLPDTLLDVKAEQLSALLDGPTLIHLSGKIKAPLFVSVLLHGNEVTGFMAIQRFLKEYQNTELPRSLSLFIGNIFAAKQNRRKLENQPDYNRIWPGCLANDLAETAMMQQVIDQMSARKVFASIDIHNTSGHNPHYACVNQLQTSFLQLANIFGRTVVYFTRPQGVQTSAFADLCPSVTLECGQTIDHDAVNHAFSYLKKIIHLKAIPSHSVNEEDIDLFHSTAIVKIPQHISFTFDPATAKQNHLLFDEHLDDLNFRELPAGTVLCKTSANDNDPATAGEIILDTHNFNDKQSFDHYFTITNNEIRTRIAVMPSMLSTDEDAIKQDCLCFLMERVKTNGSLY